MSSSFMNLKLSQAAQADVLTATADQKKADNAASQAILQASFASAAGITDTSRSLKLKPAFLISIGQKHKKSTEQQYLESVVTLVSKQISTGAFNSVTVLAAGSLQRHNWWMFTHQYTDEALADYLADLPEGASPSELAYLLAEKFLPDAQQAEEKYISDHINIFNRLKNVFDIKKWFDVIPADFARNKSTDHTENNSTYISHFETLKQLLETKPEFKDAVEKTIDNFMMGKQKEIDSQGKRIQKANPKLAQVDFTAVAKAASLHYLLEECPYLIPMLSEQGFTHIFYPGKITPALAATKKLTSPSDVEWAQINLKLVNLAKRRQELEKLIPLQTLSLTPMTPISTHPAGFFTDNTPTPPSQRFSSSSEQDERKLSEDSPLKESIEKIDIEMEKLVLNAASKSNLPKETIISMYKQSTEKRLTEFFTQLGAMDPNKVRDDTALNTAKQTVKPTFASTL